MKKEKAFNMRARRHELDLTIEELALKAKVSPSTVRQLETGVFNPKLLIKMQIADALEIPVQFLMTADELKVVEKFLLEPKGRAVQMSTKKD